MADHILDGTVKKLVKHLASRTFTLEELQEGLAKEKRDRNRKSAKIALKQAIRALKPIDTEEAPAAADSEPGETPVVISEAKITGTVEVRTMEVEISSSPCTYRMQDCDILGMAVCGVHEAAVCLPCSHNANLPNNCLIACQDPVHKETEQPNLNWGTHSTKPTNPAEVEAMPLAKFDAEK